MTDRIHSIDALRVAAIVFVITAHTRPFHEFGEYGNHIYFIIDTIGQFDLPFFFMASGYFLATRLRMGTVRSYISNAFKKLTSYYLFGILFALPILLIGEVVLGHFRNEDVAANLVNFVAGIFNPAELLYYGTSVMGHLWFLPALFFAICFVSFFVATGKTRYVLPVAASLHIVGLIGQNFPMILEIPVETRDAVFFGFFYVALGFQLRRVNWEPKAENRRLYLGAFVAFLIAQLAEQYAYGYLLHDLVLSQEVYSAHYTISTVFFVFTLFTYAISNPNLTENSVLPDLGKYVLGIYLIHSPLVTAFEGLNEVVAVAVGVNMMSTLWWHLLFTPLILVLSLVIYIMIAKIGIIEIEGSHIPRLSRIRDRFVKSNVEQGSASD